MPVETRAAARRRRHLLHLPVELRDIILDYVIILSDKATNDSFSAYKVWKTIPSVPKIDDLRLGGRFEDSPLSPGSKNPRAIHLPGRLPPIVSTLRLLSKSPD